MRKLLYLLAVLLIPALTLGQTQHDRIVGRGTSTYDRLVNTATIVITGATPDVSTGNVFKTNNGGATTITNFVNGVDTQLITIICGEANTIIANNANIVVTGGSNFNCSLNVALSFVYNAASGKWSENGGTGGGGGGGSPGAPTNGVQCNGGSNTFVACNATDNGTTFAVTENHSVTGNQTVGGTSTVTGAVVNSSTLQVNGATTLKGDANIAGPNPHVDIRAFGARSTVSFGTPFAPGITANCTNASASVPISAASSFQNGDGVTLFGCGAAHSMTTPVAPTVTPSLAYSGTGTGSVVPGPAGATTYNYQVVARDKKGGLTAVSTVGTTAVGISTLGLQSVSITSISKSGTVNTATTSGAHGLAPGAFIIVTGTNDDTDFSGWFFVSTAPDTTHFTYINGMDSANGAGTASTGGTVSWWNCNHLSWTAVTGAFEYYIYGRTGGSLTLLGVTRPTNTGIGFPIIVNTWDDFGSPMMDGFTAPYFVPSTPAGAAAATSDSLTTTISSGAGTTTLTLANAASTTVSGVTILFDNAPNIVAAVTSVRNTTGGTLYIPVGQFVANSYLSIQSQTAISLAGSLFLNDTLELSGGVKMYGNLTPQSSGAPSFGWEGFTGFGVGRANPAVYFPSGGGNGLHGLSWSTAQTNNALFLLMDQMQSSIFEKLNFATTGNADYMSTHVLMRGNIANSSFFNIFKELTMISGPGGGVFSATPLFDCDFCGLTRIDNVSFSRRAFHFGATTDLSIKNGRYQGGIAPFIIVGGFPGSIFSRMKISQIEEDTTGSPLIVNVNGVTNPDGSDNSIFTLENSGYPSSLMGVVSGIPAGKLMFVDTSPASGQNVHTTLMGGSGVFARGTGTSIEVGGTSVIGYALAQPSAPTVVVGSGGSCVSFCVAAGTYYYAFIPADTVGRYGAASALSSAATTDGTKTITISWTPVSGQVLAYIGRGVNANGNGFVYRGDSGGVAVPGTGYVDSSLISYSCSTPCAAVALPNGTASGANVLGITTPQLTLSGGGFGLGVTGTFTANRARVEPDIAGTYALANAPQTWSGNQTGVPLVTPSIGGETLSSAPRGPWNALFPGALTTTWTGESWTLDKAITVTRVQGQLRTAPAGCGANAIVRVSDGSTNINLTLTAASNDSGAISQNYAAGATLTLAIPTAAASCTTSPGDANVVVQYKMQ